MESDRRLRRCVPKCCVPANRQRNRYPAAVFALTESLVAFNPFATPDTLQDLWFFILMVGGNKHCYRLADRFIG